MDRREAKERILKAMVESSYRWRTARGIAKDSGVPLPQVLEFLDRSDLILRARKPNRKGEPLFTTRERYRHEVGLGERILSAITNKLPE
jgi:hypothetical protein